MKDRASRLYGEGKLREARELYEEIARQAPGDLGCRLKLGDVLRRLGDRPAAVAAYEEVARRYADDGLLLKAIAVCKLILGLEPSHTETQARLADLYSKRRAGSIDVPALPLVKNKPAATATDDVLAAWPTSQPVLVPSRVVNGEPVCDGEGLEIEVEPDGDLGITLELTDVVSDELDEPLDTGSIEEDSSAAPAESALLIPLFSDLPKRAFMEVLVRMKMHQLEPGEVILREGDDGDSFFVLASGIVSVTRRDGTGRQQHLAQLGDGAFFGEMALLQGGRRTATVRVEERAHVFEISRGLLEELIEQFPTVATAVRNFYRQRLLATAMATHSLFASFKPLERRELMGEFKSRSFAPNEVILEEGKKGNGLYLLLHGRVEVSRLVNQEPLVLAELGPGDVFGEMSLLTGEPTTASITALDDSYVLRLSKKRFDELIMTHGPVLDMMSSLSAERSERNRAVLQSQQLVARGAVLV